MKHKLLLIRVASNTNMSVGNCTRKAKKVDRQEKTPIRSG